MKTIKILQVLHGCRQLMLGDVTLASSPQHRRLQPQIDGDSANGCVSFLTLYNKSYNGMITL